MTEETHSEGRTQHEEPFVTGLAKALGHDRVRTDPKSLAWAAEDASGAAGVGRTRTAPVLPICVVEPRTTGEVVRTLEAAAAAGISVVARGSGTGVMGAARVTCPSIVVDLARLDDIAVHPEDGLVEVGAGAVLGDINRRIAPLGFVLGHDPWSVGIASAGGAFSTDGVGYMAGRWGSMREQVAALEAVLGDGTVLRTRPFKPAFGPDPRDLFAGAQGTLGIVTRLWLYLRPLGRSQAFSTFRFAGFDPAYAALRRLWETGVRYDLLDLSDDLPEELEVPAGFEDGDGRTAVLHLGALGEPEDAKARMAIADRILSESGRCLGSGPAQAYWDGRHHWAEIYDREIQSRRDSEARRAEGRSPRLDYLNLMLWPSRIPEFRRTALERVRLEPGLAAGEAGIWCRPELFSLVVTADDNADPARLDHVLEELARTAQDLGGTAESIHGTGLRWARLMAREAAPVQAALRRIHDALDPEGRLNPGKFPTG